MTFVNEAADLTSQTFAQLSSIRPRKISYPETDGLVDLRLLIFDDTSFW